MSALPSGRTRILSKGYGMYGNVRGRNITAAIKISEVMKTMLGPKGMDKMLVFSDGNVVITNSGRTALEKMRLVNPISKIVVNGAKIQDIEAGDGTKTVVILVGELLKRAGLLLNQKVHPAVIIRGYDEATKKALEILDKVAVKISIDDEELLMDIAKTATGGRIIEDLKDRLASIVVAAVKRATEKKADKTAVDVNQIDIRKKAGGSINDSKLVEGLIIYKERPHQNAPMKLENAKIVLFGCSIDPFTRKNTKLRKEYVIEDPEQLRGFLDAEREFAESIVKRIKHFGANVLFCRKKISNSVLNCFTRNGILALELTGEQDMIRLEKLTGAKIISDVDDLDKSDLGKADLVEFQKIVGDEMLFIYQPNAPKASTILIRGGTDYVVEELERIVKNCIKAVAVTIEEEKIVAGGGATEMEIAKGLKDFSITFRGKEQLAIDAFADAVVAVPKNLAANAGLDPINVLLELRTEHAKGVVNFGVNVLTDKLEDVVKSGVVDAFKVKSSAIKIASEIATAILRIDGAVLATSQREIKEEKKRGERMRQLIQEKKARDLLKREEDLKTLSREMMEKAAHPETV